MFQRWVFSVSFALLLVTYHSLLTASYALDQPISLTDAIGQTITLSKPATRIVSLAPSITEILYALDLDDEIVGVTLSCDYPPQAVLKPKVGGLVYPSVERIISMEPDLILAVKGMHPANFIHELRRLHLLVYVMDPSSVSAILNDIQVAGELTGRRKEAVGLAGDMEKKIKEIRKISERRVRPKVLYILWHDPLMTVSKGSFIGELVEIAGGTNVASSDREVNFRMSMEEVLSQNPDVVIFSSEIGESQVRAERERWKRWSQIEAVREGRLYELNSSLIFRPGPRIVEGLSALMDVLHPEAVLFQEDKEIHARE